MAEGGIDTGRRKEEPHPKRVKGLTVDQIRSSLNKLLPDHEAFIQEHIIQPLCPSDSDYRRVQQLLEDNFDRGLNKDTHDTASVKMYTSYVREVPDGTEKGKFLALDFSGSNFRVLLECLEGTEDISDSKSYHIPSKILRASGAELFQYLADCVYNFLESRDLLSNITEPNRLPLGLTFSFPCQQLALNKAVLTKWAKGFHCDGVEGQDVGQMLQEALNKKMGIDVDAIVNDTVGTLMSGALEDSKCAIGLILGRGTNACYIESLDKVGTWGGETDEPQQVIINTAWHDFGRDGCLDFMRSGYDDNLDEQSKHKGHAIYEKMVGGMYLGELVRLVLVKLQQNEVLYHDHWSDVADIQGHFYTKYISEILDDETVRFKHTRHVFDELEMHYTSETECKVLHHLCRLITIRAAHLASIGVASLLNRINRPEVGIAVDGSLFRFHPQFRDMLTEFIPLYLKTDVKFWFVPATDGSGKGAALAAAVAERRLHNR